MTPFTPPLPDPEGARIRDRIRSALAAPPPPDETFKGGVGALVGELIDDEGDEEC